MAKLRKASTGKVLVRLKKIFEPFLFIGLVIIVPTLIVGYRIFQDVFPSWDVPTVVSNVATVPQVKQLSFLHTSGRYIVNDLNRPVVLRGVNVGSIEWAEPSWHPKAITYLGENWPLNVIRIRVLEKDYIADKDGFFRNLEWEFLRPARAQGLYVIIHPKVIDVATDLADADLERMWVDIGSRYKDDPAILYDVMPEPHDVPMSRIVATYTRVITELRAVAPKSLIFVSGDNWGRNINYYDQNPLPFENLVYRTNPYNEAYFFPEQFEKIMADRPVFIGEFGPSDHPFMSPEAVTALLKVASDNQLGWTAWNFHSSGCPCLLSDSDNFILSSYGFLIKSSLTL